MLKYIYSWYRSKLNFQGCLLHATWTVVGSSPNPNLHKCLWTCLDWKGSAAMLTSIQSAGVTSELNLRITQVRKHATDPPWHQMSPEVPNRTYVLQKFLKKVFSMLFTDSLPKLKASQIMNSNLETVLLKCAPIFLSGTAENFTLFIQFF